MVEIRHNMLPTMQGAANYRIRVRGRVDTAWSTRLGGMQIKELLSPEGDVETILVGRLAD